MKPTRRGFLGGLLGAPAVLPDVVKEMAVNTVSAPIAIDYTAAPSQQYSGLSDPVAYSAKAALRDVKAEMSWFFENIDPVSVWTRRVNRIDADIASSRSLSLSAKMRLQAERNRSQFIEEQEGSYMRRIAELTKKIGGG
jgi:hypothetical protein